MCTCVQVSSGREHCVLEFFSGSPGGEGHQGRVAADQDEEPPQERTFDALAAEAEEQGDPVAQALDDGAAAVKVGLAAGHALDALELGPDVRHVAHADELLHPRRRLGHRAEVGEAVEAGLAAVVAHAAVAHAAEGDRVERRVEEAVVERGTARGHLVEN